MYAVVRRGRKVLEERIARDEERIVLLEKELEVTILFGEEADRKYEEVSASRSIATNRQSHGLCYRSFHYIIELVCGSLQNI